MNKNIFLRAWETTWMSMEESLSDWRFYVGVVVCIGVVLAFHLLVYRLPALLATYIVALFLSGVFIVLDVVRDREALRQRERAEGEEARASAPNGRRCTTTGVPRAAPAVSARLHSRPMQRKREGNTDELV